MENSKKYEYLIQGRKYIINRSISEYLIDEPCGGGKNITYEIPEGISLENFMKFAKEKNENNINSLFLREIGEKIKSLNINKFDKENKDKENKNVNDFIVIHYEFNYVWDLGNKDNLHFPVFLKPINENK